MLPVEGFFRDLDAAWPDPADPGLPSPITLRLIGSTALMLRSDYRRGTNDGDVLETPDLGGGVQQRLTRLAGPSSALRTRYSMHLQFVREAILFLPATPAWHAGPRLPSIDLQVLDVVDVVVSKLKRFDARDRIDIAAMVDRGLVDHARLLARFQAAVDVFAYDARVDDLPAYLDNLHEVERDLFDVPESPVALPSWG